MTTTINEIDPGTLDDWLRGEGALVVDVREPFEHAVQRIENSRLMPLPTFDPAALAAAAVDGGRVVLYCRTGARSARAAALCGEVGVEVYSLRGGLEAWKHAGLDTTRTPGAPRIDLRRQVQITAGSLVFGGTLLALVSPWFLILPGFVGAGLVFAGASGTCGMARLLAVMPWNRAAGRP